MFPGMNEEIYIKGIIFTDYNKFAKKNLSMMKNMNTFIYMMLIIKQVITITKLSMVLYLC